MLSSHELLCLTDRDVTIGSVDQLWDLFWTSKVHNESRMLFLVQFMAVAESTSQDYDVDTTLPSSLTA